MTAHSPGAGVLDHLVAGHLATETHQLLCPLDADFLDDLVKAFDLIGKRLNLIGTYFVVRAVLEMRRRRLLTRPVSVLATRCCEH